MMSMKKSARADAPEVEMMSLEVHHIMRDKERLEMSYHETSHWWCQMERVVVEMRIASCGVMLK